MSTVVPEIIVESTNRKNNRVVGGSGRFWIGNTVFNCCSSSPPATFVFSAKHPAGVVVTINRVFRTTLCFSWERTCTTIRWLSARPRLPVTFGLLWPLPCRWTACSYTDRTRDNSCGDSCCTCSCTSGTSRPFYYCFARSFVIFRLVNPWWRVCNNRFFFFPQMGSSDIQLDRPIACGSSVRNGARLAPDRGRIHGRRVSRYTMFVRAC